MKDFLHYMACGPKKVDGKVLLDKLGGLQPLHLVFSLVFYLMVSLGIACTFEGSHIMIVGALFNIYIFIVHGVKPPYEIIKKVDIKQNFGP